jgi:Cdc6-like AAA superfamily ATPase
MIEFYAACNLTNNPFRSTPVRESDPRQNIWVGYDKEKQQLLKHLVRTRADQVGNDNFVIIYGDYGTGKTHALRWSKDYIQGTHQEDSVVYDIQTLKRDTVSFSAAFKEDIVEKSNLVSEVLKYKQFLQESAIEYQRENRILDSQDGLKKMLQSIELFHFAKEIMQCESPDEVRKWLGKAKLSDYQAMSILSKLTNLFVLDIPLNSGIKRFKQAAYLFIDELDLLATSPAKEARSANELIRLMYDNCPNSFCMILALTATTAEIPILFAEYVLSRVNRQIKMNRLEFEEAKLFVKGILDNARVNQDGDKGYYPFEESAIEKIISHGVAITPRNIINNMQQILEEIRLCGYEPASGLVSTEFLETHRIIEE